MKKWIVGLASLLAFSMQVALCQVPHLTGNIKISVLSGTIDAELVLDNLPVSDNYTIWLNAGLNIEYFRALNDQFNFAYNTEYNSELSSEALQHYFPANDNKGRYLPTGFKVKYTGKFPVIANTEKAYDWGDWKGNIAFNGKTMRAAEQSAWYPILYDKTNDIVMDKYTYQLTVECSDCQTLYVNGEKPRKASSAVFQSDQAVPMLLFAGNYDFKEEDRIFVLNADLNAGKLNTLATTTKSIIDFYERVLRTPYGKPVVYLSSTPVSKKNEWMFVTYPTIAVIGIENYKLDNYFDDETFQFKRKSNITFIAHELAHYYFGTVFVPNSELRWFFLEGVTDYLSIKAAKEILGVDTYNSILNNYKESLKDFTPIMLDKVHLASELDETHRYKYTPLLLLAIEQEIGEAKMYDWLEHLLRTTNEKTDYGFLLRSFEKIGITDQMLNHLAEAYFTSPQAKENVLNKIN